MRFCSEMDDTVNLLALHQLVESGEVANVDLHELVVWLFLDVLQVSQIARIGELVEVDDFIFGIFVYKEAYNMRANKTCSSCDNNIASHSY